MDILREFNRPIFWVPTVISATVLVGYQNYINFYTYWERRNVKGVKPIVAYLSEVWDVLTKNRLELLLERRDKFGKVYGSFFFGKPQLMICDAEVLRQITIKDFDSFQDHQSIEFVNDYMLNSLLFLRGEHWRRVRALMTPTFTSGKIKRMICLLEGCAQDLVDNFGDQIDRSAQVDLHEIFGMYTMDGITTCCYGIKLKREQSLEMASSRNAFVRDASKLFDFNLINIVRVSLTPTFLAKFFNLKMVPDSQLRPLANRVERLIEMRRNGQGNKYDDLLQLLIEAKLGDNIELNSMDLKENHHASLAHESLLINHENLLKSSQAKQTDTNVNCLQAERSKVALSDFEILAESMFLLAAGFDTTRASLTTITYFLAHNPQVQERLHCELAAIARRDETNTKWTFDYEALTSCDYLDACISESLRIFSPLPLIDRQVNADYHIEKYNIRVKKGENIMLNLYAVHNDPDYWDNPMQFNPDRFLPGQREKIVPGSYVPFGMGPRHCIGMRFSLTETKLGLAKVLMDYKFEPAPKTKYPPGPTLSIGIVTVKNPKVCVSRRLCEAH